MCKERLGFPYLQYPENCRACTNHAWLISWFLLAQITPFRMFGQAMHRSIWLRSTLSTLRFRLTNIHLVLKHIL